MLEDGEKGRITHAKSYGIRALYRKSSAVYCERLIPQMFAGGIGLLFCTSSTVLQQYSTMPQIVCGIRGPYTSHFLRCKCLIPQIIASVVIQYIVCGISTLYRRSLRV